MIKNWSKPTSLRDIQIFIGFSNFYQYFIQSFSRIATLFTLLLKTTKLFEILAPKIIRANDNKIVRGVGGRKVNKTVKNLFKSKKFENNKSEILMYFSNIEARKKPIFQTSGAKKAFNCLKQEFIKALILQHLNLEYDIQIETNLSGYAICKKISQSTTN